MVAVAILVAGAVSASKIDQQIAEVMDEPRLCWWFRGSPLASAAGWWWVDDFLVTAIGPLDPIIEGDQEGLFPLISIQIVSVDIRKVLQFLPGRVLVLPLKGRDETIQRLLLEWFRIKGHDVPSWTCADCTAGSDDDREIED
jgi:hypothetical protein